MLAPEVFQLDDVARVIGTGPEELVRLAAAFRADGVHLCWETRAARPHRLLDRTIIDRLRRAGLAITLWHEEREDELQELVALEPDAICTNTPAILRRIRCTSSSTHRSTGGFRWDVCGTTADTR